MGVGKDSGSIKGRLSDSKHKRILFYLFFFFSTGFVATNGMLSNRFAGAMFHLGPIVLPVGSLSGCIQALSVVFCILMVLTDYRRGIILTMLTLAVSFFGASRSIILAHNATSLPGVVNCIIHGVCAFLIYRQFRLSDEMAITDSTTGLMNRHGFERDLEKKIRHRVKGYVVYLHVEGFHDLNANLGRKVGDQVLYEIGQRIVPIVGRHGTVYKIEGAEFAFILDDGCDYNETVGSVIEAISEPIEVLKNDIPVKCFVTASAGVADFKDRNSRPDEVMLCTDVAMNYAVNSSDVRICTYNDALKQRVARVTEVEKLIKIGLENDYFYLQYQPQFILEGKKLRGFEALVRMKLPDGNVISPGEFIPVAERSDLIVEIDRYVRNRAMSEFGEICGRMGDDFVLSVNVSAKEISTAGFADEVFEAIAKTGFPAKHLEIEITEYSFAQSVDVTTENINRLRKRDIKIALDDFGTGYTSLAQLLNLPVTLLKIDKSLIDNIEYSDMNKDFVKTVIYMGHLMKCDVISEGVEEEDQLKLLDEYDCDFIQGFVWSRPLDYQVALDMCG